MNIRIPVIEVKDVKSIYIDTTDLTSFGVESAEVLTVLPANATLHAFHIVGVEGKQNSFAISVKTITGKSKWGWVVVQSDVPQNAMITAMVAYTINN